MNSDWVNRYSEGLAGVKKAGQYALNFFDTDLVVETKNDLSPVTIADRGAEQTLRQHLLSRFPDDGFLGEELGNSPGSSGYRWIIDPIDGTRSFIRGIPIWGTLVGLEYHGELIAGMCYLPVWDQCYHALQGQGAFRNDRPIRVSSTNHINKAILSYSSIDYFHSVGKENVFLNLVHNCERSRSYADFYGFVLVAQGCVDLMLDFGVHSWDVAALKVIVEEAGGKMTAWNNSQSIDQPDVIATNGLLHEQALKYLADGMGTTS